MNEYGNSYTNISNKNEDGLESVLDIVEDLVNTGFVPRKHVRTTVIDKIKMNEDHSLIAYTVDIGNTERCTGGVKDMNSGLILPHIRL